MVLTNAGDYESEGYFVNANLVQVKGHVCLLLGETSNN